jgi:hypothetical protein
MIKIVDGFMSPTLKYGKESMGAWSDFSQNAKPHSILGNGAS